MAVDLQVVQPQQSISLQSVTELTGYTPRAIEVVGEDFSAVDDVEINDQLSPRWTVLSPTRLVAQVPENDTGDIYSVSVISNRLTYTKESLLKFRIGSSPGKVSGMLRLIQSFVKVLMTTPGTDAWNPKLGGGLLAKVGGNRGSGSSRGLVGDVSVSISSTAAQIMTLQAGEDNIPPSERLLSADVVRAKYDPNSLSLEVVVQILNQSLRRGYANITL